MWSTSGLFAKAPWFDGWPEESRGMMLAFWRSAFAAVILVPLIRRPCFRWPMIPMVLCFAVMVASFMSAMVYGPAANAIWFQYLAPAWVLIFGVSLGIESITRSDGWMIGCCIYAVLMMLAFEMNRGSNVFASAMGILSGLSFAGVVLSMRALRGVDPAWLITLNHSATALILLPWIWNTEGSVSTGSYFALAMFGILQMSVPYVLFAKGLKTVTGPEASVISLIEPVLVPAWVYIAWSQHSSYESPRWWTIVGGSIICISILVRYLPAAVRSRRNVSTTQNISTEPVAFSETDSTQASITKTDTT
ncbi:MAG TPA: hypothetical protein DDW52_15800 [Planctomycetaceae bacterium]|nr:hypothetical protein [Planctomycetaceae bacterium]